MKRGAKVILNSAIYLMEEYGSFQVYNLDCSYSFFYIDIKDENNFYSGLFEFVLNEDTLLSYAQGKFGIKFSPSVKHYATLYKELRYYIDSEHIEKDISDLEEDLATLLKDEYDSETKESGKSVVRLSKIGRIGEYIFHVFLADYFKFECIIPKFKLTTDMNMSVNGIDTLHLAKEEKMILLGESKVTKNLDNGIKLINKSITGYQKELEEEFILVLSNPYLKLDTFRELFGGIEEFCINFSDFIKKLRLIKSAYLFLLHTEAKQILKISFQSCSSFHVSNYLGWKPGII
ncbi:Hachiman antiphage defense system protein HamA [Paenibacillus cisolokensis]|uniref:Hachiman antiphage defense system protein HamA n=1 Tax=Paenibacillus cisolokensis TaxID=1658519 RepID=UPI001BCB5EC9|nr:Hachiman antiphage defense system protein HamA [Paenibacillus cisolokensis]